MSVVRNRAPATNPSLPLPSANPLAFARRVLPTLPRPLTATITVLLGAVSVMLFSFLRAPQQGVAAIPTKMVEQSLPSSQELIDRDSRLLAATAAERLDAVLDPLFMDFHDRVPTFGEWAFGWRTGYRFLRDGMLTAITLPFADPPRMGKINSAWDELIASKFDELVLHPAGGVPALRSAHERWLADMRPIVDAVAMDTLRTITLLHGQAQALPPRESLPPTPTEKVHLLDELPAITDPVKYSAARPLLTRFLVRPHVASAVAAAGAAMGNEGTTLIGSATQLGATIFSFLTFDFMFNQINSAVYRSGLEEDVYRVLENEHQELRKTWLAEEQERIDARLAQTRLFLSAGDATLPPNSVPGHATPGTDRPAPGP